MQADMKQTAVKELLGLIEQGQRFSKQPITDRAALAAADNARALWQLQIKKVVRQLFGEAAGMVRFSSGSLPEPEAGRASLAQDIDRFHDCVAEQLAVLERVTRLLRQLA